MIGPCVICGSAGPVMHGRVIVGVGGQTIRWLCGDHYAAELERQQLQLPLPGGQGGRPRTKGGAR